jgi:hypothetical protein
MVGYNYYENIPNQKTWSDPGIDKWDYPEW